MTTSSRSGRQAPPPVTDPNPPRPPAPTDPTPEPQPTTDIARPASVTATVTSAGTNVGNSVPGSSAWGAPTLTIESVMHGPTDPDDDRAQTGVRLPKYVTDAVRAVALNSRGRLSMQDIVTAAVKAYIPDEILREAWVRHGGQLDEHGNPITA